MPNYTVADIVYAGARIAGILGAPQRGMSGSEISDAISCLNALIDSWEIDPLMIWAEKILQFNLNTNQQVYTIGIDPAGVLPAADFPVDRPDKITHANIITQISGGQPVRTPMELLNSDGWSAIQVQATGSSIPQGLYDDYASPYSNLYFWPYPNASAAVEMYVWQRISQFSLVTDTFQMPSGYRRALEYNLAVDLSTRWRTMPLDPMVLAIAKETRSEIQAHNSPEPVMSCDDALLSAKKSSWNYLTGLPV